MLFDISSIHGYDGFYGLYLGQLVLAVASLVINGFICAFAFSHNDRFSPHTPTMRVLLIGDAVTSLAYVMDSGQMLISKSGSTSQHYITISECATSRPHLFLLLMARQWESVLVMILGIERYLFITYPLWFKVVRVRRLPILVFSTCFVSLSSAIAYTNALFITPEEPAFFTCEFTWALGENYGWCHSLVVVGPMAVAAILNAYSYKVAHQDKALHHFGNNRTRMSSERRKIRKAMWIIAAAVAAGAVPQVLVSGLHWWSHFGFQQLKLATSQLFLFKCLLNMVLVSKLAKSGGLPAFTVSSPPQHVQPFQTQCCCSVHLRKVRVDHSESIASVSYYVN